MALRYYQQEAKQAVFDYWDREPGNPLVVAATGTGKSIMQGSLTCDLLDGWSDLRIMNTTHVQELVEGNYTELLGLRHFAPAGIWASSLGRSDRNAQVLFSQLQTVHDKAEQIGHVDVLQIDEAHLVPFKQATMYRKLIDGLMAVNPDMKINGFTATDYRLDGGRLTEGEGRLFDEVVYEYGIRSGIDDGYLTPITSKPVNTNYDLTGVGRSMGEYKASDYRAAVDTDTLNRQIVQEVLQTEGHRKKALIFCRGVEHAARIRDAFKAAGRAVELVHGGTPAGERRKLINKLKSCELWGLVNDNVLSTGTNIVGVDLIVDLYKTLSAGRYVQRVGRGTRVIYPPGFDPEAVEAAERRAAIAAWIKPNCRYMDFAGNIREHGPVDMITPKKPGKGDGEAPVKICPIDEGGCAEQVHASARTCWCCGFKFDIKEKPKFEAHADTAPILSVVEPEWIPVRQRRFKYHEKLGGTPSVRAEFTSGLTIYKTWLCPQHSGFAKQKTDRWWAQHGGPMPAPKSVDEFLSRAAELADTAEISVKPQPGSKYLDVVGFKPAAANDNAPVQSASNDNTPARWSETLSDEIPF
jgi:DNA repair protein RadD